MSALQIPLRFLPALVSDYVLEGGFGFQFSPAVNSAYYFGMLAASTSTPGLAGIHIPKSGTIKKVFIRWANTGGTLASATETCVFAITLNGASSGTTVVTANVGSSSNGSLSNTNTSIAVTEGDRIELRMLTPSTWATPPTNMRFFFEVLISTGATLADDLTDITTQPSNYTLQLSDNNSIVEVSALATITLPNGLPTGFRCDIVRTGTSNVTISATTTLRNGSANLLKTQYKGCTVYHVGSNVWQAIGTEA